MPVAPTKKGLVRNSKQTGCKDKLTDNQDQPWIALTLCDNSDGVWGACSQEGNPSTLQPGSFCSCTNAASFQPVAFTDSNTLASFASLPVNIGESIQFAAGHAPTSPAAEPTTGSQETTSAGGSGGTPTRTGLDASATRSQGPTSSSAGTSRGTASDTGQPSSTGGAGDGAQPGNGSSAKSTSGKAIGIGVGVGVGTLLLIAAMAALFLLRRKRRRSTAFSRTEVEKADTSNAHTSDTALPNAGRGSGFGSNAVSEADGRPISKADYPGTSELDGNSVLEAGGTGVSKADQPGTTELMSEPILEADSSTARPWNMGSELDGRQIMPKTDEQGAVQSGSHPPFVAEMPGSLAHSQNLRNGM